ncbi:MAG TPA: ATP-binding protein [Terriglobia bacterium]|nr:ATP-binding protein [Terriglobia bacterium]
MGIIATAIKNTNGVVMSGGMGRKHEGLPVTAANGPLRFQMKLASDPRLLGVVRVTVAQLAEVLGFEASQCRRITLAVDEALSNVIRHAYKNECNHEIELNCEAQEDCLEFTFVDRGEPVDPARICSQPLNEVATGGRGTHLIRQIMDEVRYERLPGQNRLHLKKYMPGAHRKD